MSEKRGQLYVEQDEKSKKRCKQGTDPSNFHYSWITVDVRVIQKEQDPNQELYSLFPLFY